MKSFNIDNVHSRDSRITFEPEPHIYTVDGEEVISVTTLIGNFFKKFDSLGCAQRLRPSNPLYGLSVDEIIEAWEKKGREAANKGTFLHEQIEKYFLGLDYEKPDGFNHFETFVAEHSNIVPYRSEWRIFDENHHLAGTIDMIACDGEKFDMYDWKRSEKTLDKSGQPITKDNWGNRGLDVISHIHDTSYNHYCLQQSLYKYIIESNYDIKIDNMYLVIIHPVYGSYHKVSVPYMEQEIQAMLSYF